MQQRTFLSRTCGGNVGLIRMLEHTASHPNRPSFLGEGNARGKEFPGTQMEAEEKWLSEVLTTYPHLFI